jgi:hypothetical protein
VQETIICLSHLRWNFVYQRPQHLLTRCAADHHVLYFEEPVFDAREPELCVARHGDVTVCVPHLVPGTAPAAADAAQRAMLDDVLRAVRSPAPVLCYYTPMPITFTDRLTARAVVYDCMDELSLSHGAPPELTQRERQLFEQADVVFTPS